MPFGVLSYRWAVSVDIILSRGEGFSFWGQAFENAWSHL